MRIPSQKHFKKLMNLWGKEYHIIFMHKLDFINKGDMGGHDPKNKLVLISKAQDQREQFKTFWHEALHAFEAESGLTLGHPRIKKLEEFIVSIWEQFPNMENTNGRS